MEQRDTTVQPVYHQVNKQTYHNSNAIYNTHCLTQQYICKLIHLTPSSLSFLLSHRFPSPCALSFPTFSPPHLSPSPLFPFQTFLFPTCPFNFPSPTLIFPFAYLLPPPYFPSPPFSSPYLSLIHSCESGNGSDHSVFVIDYSYFAQVLTIFKRTINSGL